MARTVNTVQRASTSWAYIFSRPIPEFQPRLSNCKQLQREVKEFLSACPSSVEEERMAFQSIKKLLPDSCRCMEGEMLAGLKAKFTKPGINLPDGYLQFVRRRVATLFRKGWDSGVYESHCRTVAPSISATIESTRAEGGCLADFKDHEFFLAATTGVRPYQPPKSEAMLMVVQSAGKPRPLSKFSSGDLLVKPLHKAIYDRLSINRWLCRGDPTDDKLKSAGFRKGGFLVSGDYKSATDNLSLDVAEAILDVILENSVSVPSSIKEHARALLRPRMWNLEYALEFEVTNGQMMGSYLSFPLLCLQNYLSFEWFRRRRGMKVCPLLINGDDILFQCSTEEEAKGWMDVVVRLGLEVERTKTSVSQEFGSLNSTLFRWNDDGFLAQASTLRFGMLRHADFPQSLGRSFDSWLKGQVTEVRWRAARTFFSWHLCALRSMRFSPDEYGFRGGLAHRMTRIFGLYSTDRVIITPPEPPAVHNVMLSSESVTMVPRSAMTDELRQLAASEIAAWKFSVEFQELRVKAALRYCIAVSLVRRPIVRFRDDWRQLSDGQRGREIRKRFFRVRDLGRGLVPVFDSVLQSQDMNEFEPPPPYGAEEWGGEEPQRKW